MRRNNGKAFALLQSVLKTEEDLLKGCECPDQGLRTGLFVPLDKLAANLREWVEVLVR
jgi:hypothetical protein